MTESAEGGVPWNGVTPTDEMIGDTSLARPIGLGPVALSDAASSTGIVAMFANERTAPRMPRTLDLCPVIDTTQCPAAHIRAASAHRVGTSTLTRTPSS